MPESPPPKNVPNGPTAKAAGFLGSDGKLFGTRVFTARFENLEAVREFIGSAAQNRGFGSSAVYATQLAVDEAVTNIIEHAYGGESDEKIECTCQMVPSGMAITLRDCGKPFDPTTIPYPDLDADLENREIGGLGLYFIRQIMDEITFSFSKDPHTGKQCNVLRMVKYKES